MVPDQCWADSRLAGGTCTFARWRRYIPAAQNPTYHQQRVVIRYATHCFWGNTAFFHTVNSWMSYKAHHRCPKAPPRAHLHPGKQLLEEVTVPNWFMVLVIVLISFSLYYICFRSSAYARRCMWLSALACPYVCVCVCVGKHNVRTWWCCWPLVGFEQLKRKEIRVVNIMKGGKVTLYLPEHVLTDLSTSWPDGQGFTVEELKV